MNTWVVPWLLRWVLARLRRGDIRPAMALYGDDVVMRFPGRNSWAGEFRGKRALAEWLRRFVDSGLQIHARDILVKGPPWNTRICLRFEDHARSPEGETVYRNEGVLYGIVRWGRLRYYESHEDTEPIADFDRYLAARGDPKATAHLARAEARRATPQM